MIPDITPHDLGWASRDAEAASLRQQVHDLKALLDQALRANEALRAENRRLTTARGLPPVGWLPERPRIKP